MFSGTLTSGVRDRKEQLRFKTKPLDLTAGRAWRALVQGDGHSWSFDDSTFWVYADGTGFPPHASETGAVRATTGVLFGAGYARVTGTLGWDLLTTLGIGASSTFFTFWRRNTGQASPAWEHWIYNGGVKYRNGVQTGASTPWFAVGGGSNGTVRFLAEETAAALSSSVFAYTAGAGPAAVNHYVTATVSGTKYLYLVTVSGSPSTFNGGGTPTATFNATFVDSNGYTFRNVGQAWGLYDDSLFLPTPVPASWISELYAEASARAWTSQPHLRVSGTLLPAALTMRGRLADSPFVRAGFSGLSNGEQLDFSLEEI